MSCDYSRSPSLFSFFSCFVFKQILRSWSFLLITYKEQTIARVLQVPLPNDCLIIHRCSLISLGKSYAALPRYNLHVMNLFVNPRLSFSPPILELLHLSLWSRPAPLLTHYFCITCYLPGMLQISEISILVILMGPQFKYIEPKVVIYFLFIFLLSVEAVYCFQDMCKS